MDRHVKLTHNSNETVAPTRPRGSFSPLRKWKWAYRKIRTLHCSSMTAIWRATRFAMLGETGYFFTSKGRTKLKVSSGMPD